MTVVQEEVVTCRRHAVRAKNTHGRLIRTHGIEHRVLGIGQMRLFSKYLGLGLAEGADGHTSGLRERGKFMVNELVGSPFAG